MRPIRFPSRTLIKTLQKNTVATLAELSSALGGCSSSTVYRKLKQVDYIVSYSHHGKYYALLERADFDSHGLWFHKGIRFSERGTLRRSVQALVETSPMGYSPSELDALLKVRTIDALAALAREKQLARTRFAGRSVYCASDPAKQARQMEARRIRQSGTVLPDFVEPDAINAAAVVLFFSLLNEKQRRLFAGLASLLWGYGGDKRVAKMLGLSRKTVRRGRQELNAGDIDPSRIRVPGGGRPSLQKKTLDDRTAPPVGETGDSR